MSDNLLPAAIGFFIFRAVWQWRDYHKQRRIQIEEDHKRREAQAAREEAEKAELCRARVEMHENLRGWEAATEEDRREIETKRIRQLRREIEERDWKNLITYISGIPLVLVFRFRYSMCLAEVSSR